MARFSSVNLFLEFYESKSYLPAQKYHHLAYSRSGRIDLCWTSEQSFILTEKITMRLAAPAFIYLVLTGCSSTGEPRIPSGCSMADCFFERSVRDFDVLDNETAVVYVGAQRCPYLLQLDGFFCDLRAAPYLEFEDVDGRICHFDRSFVHAGPFSGADPDDVCRILEVKPLTDDGLLELYVEEGILPPPPPTNPARIEVGNQEKEEETRVGKEVE